MDAKLKEKIAKMAINIVNKCKFAEKDQKKGVTTSQLRNLLNHVSKDYAINVFILYLSYQQARADTSWFDTFSREVVNAIEILKNQGVNQDNLPKIIRELMIDIVMGARYKSKKNLNIQMI